MQQQTLLTNTQVHMTSFRTSSKINDTTPGQILILLWSVIIEQVLPTVYQTTQPLPLLAHPSWQSQ